MASAREIKNRMKGVRDTQKITNAMYLIASTKLQRARTELDQSHPYFEAVRAEIKRIFRKAGDVDSIYFYPPDGEKPLNGTYGCLVITADKGLAGAYNQCVLKEAQKLLDDHPDTKLFVVGEYGRQYYAKRHIPIEQSFLYTAQSPTVQRSREITEVLLEQYDAGKIEKVYIIFTDMKNRLNQEAITHRLLPFHRKYFTDTLEKEKPVTREFEFVPSVQEVLASAIRSVVAGFIYGALVDSFCCEQSARMAAMDSANRNAEKIMDDLSIQYNRVRQAAITQEITEVSAGAKAQKRKHAHADDAPLPIWGDYER
ncbi:MAG: ATP synthase F1 subunit gamma [Clostridiales bacterium]|nr:ATP synthase F1 subunit gamma [Clostridiales bacterium]